MSDTNDTSNGQPGLLVECALRIVPPVISGRFVVRIDPADTGREWVERAVVQFRAKLESIQMFADDCAEVGEAEALNRQAARTGWHPDGGKA